MSRVQILAIDSLLNLGFEAFIIWKRFFTFKFLLAYFKVHFAH